MNGQKLLKSIATLGSIGYMPAQGTVASFITLISLLYLKTVVNISLFFVISFCVISFGIIHLVLPQFNDKDPKQIVLDEVIGTLIACFSPSISYWILINFCLFRIFDIVKWPFIWRIEKLNGALGVIGDDAVAAFFSIVITRLLVIFFT